MRWGLTLGIVVGLKALSSVTACSDSIDRDAPPRYYIAPDASEDPNQPNNETPDSPQLDAATESDAPRSTYDPRILPLTGWWRASYTDGLWVANLSAGTSATRNLVEVTNAPAAGASVNGLAPAAFDGTDDVITNASPLSTLLSAGAWSCVLLVYVDAVSAATTPRLVEMIGDTAGFWEIGTYNSPTPKLAIAQFDVAQKLVQTDVKLAEWNLVQAKYDGVNLSLRINSGSWASAPSGKIAKLTGTLNVGQNYTKTVFFKGKMLEVMVAPTAFPDTTFDEVKGYVNTRYAFAL